MPVPIPTPIYRLIHGDNLEICLRRGGIHAPNFTPNDGLCYTTIHNTDIQMQRRIRSIPCGPCGVVHDYVSFYFGPRSPMLFQLHTGRVEGYNEGQDPIIYLVSTAQNIAQAKFPFVFSDGHGIARFTTWFDDLASLDQIDWDAVNARIWKDTVNDMDRQRRKQAEFLVHRFCDWSLIQEIGVVNRTAQERVERILAGYPPGSHRNVTIQTGWYY
jgi:hypothetical protein